MSSTAEDFTSDDLLTTTTTSPSLQGEDLEDLEDLPAEEEQNQPIEIARGSDDNSAEDRKLFVGGLSWETKEPQLKDYFEKFGEIESINLKLDPVTGRSRCFAFLVFKEPSSVNQVLGGGDREHAINSKKVDVKRARAKPGKIFCGGLTTDLSDEEIRNYFSQFGSVTDCEMPFDKSKNQRKNFCFITFEREETMKEVLKLPKQKIGEVELDVKKATPKIGYRGGGYGGYMDYYYGYPDYYGWGAAAGQEGQGGKSARQKGVNRSAPY